LLGFRSGPVGLGSRSSADPFLDSVRRGAASSRFKGLFFGEIQDSKTFALVIAKLDLPFRRQPHYFHALKAKSPADDLPIAQQERVASEHRLRESEFAEGLLDDVLDRAAGMVHLSLVLGP
jgi:hypothetical protein